MRRSVMVAIGTCLALGAAVPLSIGPIVRHRVESAAAARGLKVEIGRVSLGWRSVTLHQVRADSVAGNTLELEVEAVRIHSTWTLGVGRVAAFGGNVVLRGSVRELSTQFESIRGNTHAGRGGSGRDARTFDWRGFGVVWHPAPGVLPQHLWGVRVHSLGDSESAEFELARIALPGIGLDIKRAALRLARGNRERHVESATGKGVRAWLDLEKLGDTSWYSLILGDDEAVSDGGRLSPPSTERARSKAKSEKLGHGDAGAAEVLPKPALRSAPSTKPREPESVQGESDDARRRGVRLRDRFSQAASVLAGIVPDSGRFELSGLELEVRNAGQTLNVGPARFELGRKGKAIRVALRPGAMAASGIELNLDLPLEKGPVELAIAGGPISLAALGVREGDFGLERVSAARVEAKANIVLLADGSALRVDGSANLRELALLQPRLSDRTLQHINLGVRGTGELSFEPSRIQVDAVQLELGAVRFEAAGSIERSGDDFSTQVTAKVPLASCQTMLESAPDGLFPALKGLRMSGTFSLNSAVVFDTRRVADAEVSWKLANRCRVTAVPANVDPRNFQRPFAYSVKTEGGVWRERESGPGTSEWIYLGAVSKYMETAVLVCEDGRFYGHDGFDQYAIQSAIRQNLEAGRFLLGASTVSMQLAKNLYLGREKTLARKLQEAVFTLLLEQQLTKEQILELYLNVIEFGPGLYGIGPAARFYFDKTPAELSLAQALYLTSILPNPKHDHFDAEGRLGPRWQSYLQRLMHIAFERNLISPEELELGLREQLVFGESQTLAEASADPEVRLETSPALDPYEGSKSRSDRAESAARPERVEGEPPRKRSRVAPRSRARAPQR